MRSLTHYPNFVTLATSHKVDIDMFTKQYLPYSDFNFTSLYCWQGDSKTEIAVLGHNLVIKLPDYLTGKPVISLLGSSNIDEALIKLLADIDKLKLVPEVVVEGISDRRRFVLEEDRDNFDYLYETRDLVELTGSEFKKLRNKLSDFRRDHQAASIEVRVATRVNSDLIKRIININDKWSDLRKDKHEAHAETEALKKLLENAFLLDVLVVELFIDDQIKGFSVNEILPNGNAICHFEKSLKTYHQHTSHYLVHEVSKILMRAGVHTVNWEQDLGVTGLRRAKEAYRPKRYLKKYTVVLSD